MIPEQRQPRLLDAARRVPVRHIALTVLVVSVALLGACDKVPLLAPTGTTITLFTNTQLLPLGGTADVTASVLESSGQPVQNGTVVTFTTSLGSIEPAEARTNGGKANVKLLAGTRSGTAEISAFSGSSTATAKLSIPIGAAAVGNVLVSASPTRVPSTGGSTEIVATVQDTGGNVLSGVPVAFTTTQGVLSPAAATSGSDGTAKSTLTTNQDSTVTVTAGAKTGTVAITATAVPIVTINPPATTPSVGVSALFTISITPGNAAAPIRSVLVDWDDGKQQSLGAASGSVTVPHTFLKAGTYEVEVTATDALNQTTRVTAPVDVFPAVPFTITLSASTGRVGSPVTITATPPVGAPVIVNYTWNVGGSIVGHADGIISTTIPTVTVTYDRLPCSASVCTVQINLTATGADGRIGFGSTTTTITP